MKRILLPTDFSENSWNAITYALQLFKDQKCIFTLLNTYTPVIYNYDSSAMGSEQFELEEYKHEASRTGLKTIQKWIDDDFKNENHTFAHISAFNTLSNEINALYQGNVMDLIVMGTQGASGVKGVLFGSNTMHVINKSKCPVLAIPNDFKFEEPHEILFPSDYNIGFQDHHIHHLLEIINTFNARLNILHVSQGRDPSEQQERNRLKLEAYLKTTAYLFHIVKLKNVPEAIAEFQLKSRINLLVMINNKHSFFENLFFTSNIKRIGFHLNIPLLVIPSRI